MLLQGAGGDQLRDAVVVVAENVCKDLMQVLTEGRAGPLRRPRRPRELNR